MAAQRHRAQLAIKRAVDVVVAAVALLLLSPLMAVIAAAILLTMGPPVLFRHRRLGLAGREFTLLKFRTMRGRPPAHGVPLDDEQRITRLGRVLRLVTFEELTELVNVLRGDLSLVGPRPLLPEYREFYTPEQWRRHEMPPGMAGPALAAGRNALSWEDKFAADVAYVDHWSLWLDAKIMLKTIPVVLFNSGRAA